MAPRSIAPFAAKKYIIIELKWLGILLVIEIINIIYNITLHGKY